MAQLILASQSPRRARLLELAGYQFTTEPSRYEEDMTLSLPPHELAEFLASQKAKEVASRKKGVILAADTFVVYENKILGKPKDKQDAIKTLRMLSGKQNTVYCGVAVINTETGESETQCVKAIISLRELSEKEILYYINTKEPLDRAGSYAIQTDHVALLDEIHGSYYAVMGLPIKEIEIILKKYNIKSKFSD